MEALQAVLDELHAAADARYLERMQHFGIDTAAALGLRIPQIRALARVIGKDHVLAQELWQTGLHEARLLAVFISDYRQVSSQQIDQWAADFSSWDLCDQASALFVQTPWFDEKVYTFAARTSEFEKRCAFSMIAEAAVHLKKRPDGDFIGYLALIEHHAADHRNFVRKAVNWALRQLGKRSMMLHEHALQCAGRILSGGNKAAFWVAQNALTELQGEKVRKRLGIS